MIFAIFDFTKNIRIIKYSNNLLHKYGGLSHAQN